MTSVSLVGQTIGNYKVVQQIGEGGMGVVYLAEHPVIGRKVAIKLLHASFAHDTDTVARFFNEARAIHLIRHHNIVEILDFGQTSSGQPYFIMEFLVGESLADRVARGPMPWAEAVAVVSQICDALQAAHDKHIVHRDLKPHNVFLVGDMASPDVKILDFGVAKMTTGWGDATESGGQSVKTRTGSLMGTPLYMSPEQCRGSGKLDHRTDIYSLAVILFEMIAGRPPFMAEGVGELFAKHMLEPAPSLATLAPETPPHIVAAVARALSKNLEDRFPDMRSMRVALNTREPESAARASLFATRDTVAGLGSAATSSGGGHTEAHHRSSPRRDTEAVGPGPRASTMSPSGAGASGRSVSGIQSTTLSSSVSEVDDSLDGLPRNSRKGWLFALAGAVSLVAIAIFAARRTGPAVSDPKKEAPTSSGAAMATGVPSAAAPRPAPVAAAPTVSVHLDAEPALTHVWGPSADATASLVDLGAVPLDLTVARSSTPTEYVFRAEGRQERAVRVEPSRDRSLHVTLEHQPAATADRKIRPPERRAPTKPVHRPAAMHDADGLAVPSF